MLSPTSFIFSFNHDHLINNMFSRMLSAKSNEASDCWIFQKKKFAINFADGVILVWRFEDIQLM